MIKTSFGLRGHTRLNYNRYAAFFCVGIEKKYKISRRSLIQLNAAIQMKFVVEAFLGLLLGCLFILFGLSYTWHSSEKIYANFWKDAKVFTISRICEKLWPIVQINSCSVIFQQLNKLGWHFYLIPDCRVAQKEGWWDKIVDPQFKIQFNTGMGMHSLDQQLPEPSILRL